MTRYRALKEGPWTTQEEAAAFARENVARSWRTVRNPRSRHGGTGWIVIVEEWPKRRLASPGEVTTCLLCKKTVTLRGDLWLDADGTTGCIRGHLHSPNPHSSLPDRLFMPE